MSRTGAPDQLVGDVLDGRYEVLQRLARGGMATVYRAWDRRLERIVAIKVMHEGLGDDSDFVAKFDREARAAARLCDQSVVSIFDQGHDHGRPYIVMEFVEGSTLRSIITRDAPLSPLRALQMIEPVAAALAVAHDSGLVHRDVKPENVLISDRGVIKVADFGLARTITAQTSTHTQGLLIGTVSYLPPELLTSGRADSWSDVYSTGVMLFEMLTGSKPYTGDTPITVAYKHVNEDIPLPSAVLAQNHPVQARREPIPDYVDALVAACTRRNPQARPADGRELLRRVRRVRRALERGIRSDEALAALVFPAAALPWSIEPTEIISPDSVPTAVLHQLAALTTGEPQPMASGVANPVHLDSEPLTPVEPLPAVVVPPVHAARPPSRPPHGQPVAVQAFDGSVSNRFPGLSQSRRKRRQSVTMTILVLLLAVSVGLGGWWFASGRYVTTPSVINHTRAEAEAIAQASGMTISFTEEYSETVPVGLVMRSVPGPGDRVVRTTRLAAVISQGPERFAVPRLVGLTLDEARSALSAVNLLPGTITEDWSESQIGMVIGAGFNEGDLLKRGATVDLTVSRGREPLTIPSVVNMLLEDAQRLLTDAGFEVAIGQEKADSKVPKGSVISQEPANGTGHRGDTITLVVSKGAEMVRVPEVRKGDRLDDALKRLEGAGFEVEVIWEGAVLPALGKVTRVTDEAGNELAKDAELPARSKVKLYVSIL